MTNNGLNTKFYHRTWYREKDNWTFKDFFNVVIDEATNDENSADWRITNNGLRVELSLYERFKKRGQMKLNKASALYLLNGLLATNKVTPAFEKHAHKLIEMLNTGNTDERLM